MYKIELLCNGKVQKTWRYESKEMFLRWAKKHRQRYVRTLSSYGRCKGHTWSLRFWRWTKEEWGPLPDIPEFRGL